MSAGSATSYDAVPYDELAFAQTHPDRLATMARLFGLRSPDVWACRVLELGCASGANIVPMAFNLPGSTFVGVDLSRRQIERGLETVRALDLKNIDLRHASILEIAAEWGLFDYIICHGVFSWVETEVQDAIFRIARENLSPTGVAYISYNTYPGWHMRESARHMMRYHTAQFEEPSEQIEQARALLTFLLSASDDGGAYGQLLAREAERLAQTSDAYLFHEHLEQTNTPCYFHQFMERAECAGLSYLSEASISDMLTSHFPTDVAETLDRISPDILHLEQYMDFVRNRLFRQTLLVHKDQRPQRAVTPAFMHGLMVSSAAMSDAQVDLSTKGAVTFRCGNQHADVSLTATKAALSILAERWPEAVSVDELCALALERAAPYLDYPGSEEATRTIMGDLFGGFLHGIVNVHTYPPDCTRRPSGTPRASRLAAYQATHTGRVVTPHHHLVEIDDSAARLLELADGRRSRRDIVDILVRGTADSRTAGAPNDPVGDSRQASTDHTARRVDTMLAELAKRALLVQ